MEWKKRNKKIFLFLVLPAAMAAFLSLEIILSAAFSVSLTIFFFIPVSLTIWGVGRRAGTAVLAVSILFIFIIHLLKARPPAALSHYWNLSSQSAILAVVAFILMALKKSLQREENLSRTDYLTGAVNGRCFFEWAEREKTRAERYKQPFSIAYLDIDDFKMINDAYGHRQGDVLLKEVVAIIKTHIRSIDTVARLGGDEFALLLPNADYHQAHDIVQRINSELPAISAKANRRVTCSAGAVTCPAGSSSIEEIINEADRLMYTVKLGGKNNFSHIVLAK